MARSQAAEAAPSGLRYVEGFVTAGEEPALLAELDALRWDNVVMHGVTARRLVRHFGMSYSYTSFTVADTEPIPPWLHPLRVRCAALAECAPDELAEVLLTRYPPGAGIGWHRDSPGFGRVVGVSLGSACTMRFRRGPAGARVTWSQHLAPRSAYVIRGGSRWTWQHGIDSTPALRHSITFRTLRQERDPVSRG